MAAEAEEPDEAGRAIYTGDGAAFAELLRPLAVEKGKALCTYTCETATVSKALLDVESVTAHTELLAILRAAQENLAFKKSTVESGIRALASDGSIKVAQIDFKDFVDTTCRRIRNLCRVVSQAELRPSPPKWVLDMPWRSDEATPDPKRLRVRAKTPDSAKKDCKL